MATQSNPQIKEVTLEMSEADLKTFTRSGGTRKRRTAAKKDGEMVGGVAPLVEKANTIASNLGEPVVQPPAPPATVIPVTTAPSVTQTPAPMSADVTVVGGAVAPVVKIRAAKKSLNGPVPAVLPASGGANAPKIVFSKKRTLDAPPVAATVKKSRLTIPNVPPKNSTTPAKAGTHHNTTYKKKRQFSARKVSIEVKPISATRKNRRNLKKKIATMPIESVKKLLLRKGVLKPKAEDKMPPEDMLRSMLKDYLLLHAAE